MAVLTYLVQPVPSGHSYSHHLRRRLAAILLPGAAHAPPLCASAAGCRRPPRGHYRRGYHSLSSPGDSRWRPPPHTLLANISSFRPWSATGRWRPCASAPARGGCLCVCTPLGTTGRLWGGCVFKTRVTAPAFRPHFVRAGLRRGG